MTKQNNSENFAADFAAAEIFANLKFPPRSYQVAAFQNWQKFCSEKTHAQNALFQMATGSGKTWLMATLMLDLYLQGFRNFIFFVNSVNILAQAKDNFLNPGAAKYLFQPEIFLQGRRIKIREVQNFVAHDPDAINILFTTTQRLHQDLATAHENRLTIYDFAEQKIALFGDEAHHNNSNSLRGNFGHAETAGSWEATLAKILRANPETLLLEFTATMDFENQSIYQKYEKNLLYKYTLLEFYADKFSKEVLLFEADETQVNRFLDALILSTLRKFVADAEHVFVKPVILFKSKTILENQRNLAKFTEVIANLTLEQIAERQKHANETLEHVFATYEKLGVSLENILATLKHDFARENILRVDGGKILTPREQKLIGTLENAENHVRAIFAVDMLKEGWDVLNLFDIVRLYETREKTFVKTGEPGRTTISEAQLIGRGARYCPFVRDGKIFAKRAFDDDAENHLRWLEQLHYHSPRDVQYIAELKQALNKTGIEI